MLAAGHPHATADGKAADPDRLRDTRRDEIVNQRFAVDLFPDRATRHANGAVASVYSDAVYRGQIEDKPLGDDRIASRHMPTGLDREVHAVVACEIYDLDDVCGTGSLRNRGRFGLRRRVPQPTSFLKRHPTGS